MQSNRKLQARRSNRDLFVEKDRNDNTKYNDQAIMPGDHLDFVPYGFGIHTNFESF